MLLSLIQMARKTKNALSGTEDIERQIAAAFIPSEQGTIRKLIPEYEEAVIKFSAL
jgi:hypothetical protein